MKVEITLDIAESYPPTDPNYEEAEVKVNGKPWGWALTVADNRWVIISSGSETQPAQPPEGVFTGWNVHELGYSLLDALPSISTLVVNGRRLVRK